MNSLELKSIRVKIGARQKDLAVLLGVPVRTYQNWEQREGGSNHRKIPPEFAEKIIAISDLLKDGVKLHNLTDIAWLQLPVKSDAVTDLTTKANYLDQSLTTLISKAVDEILKMSFSELDEKFDSK